MPRIIARLFVKVRVHCGQWTFSPCSANSVSQYVRARKPRSSCRSSSSISQTPGKVVLANFISEPLGYADLWNRNHKLTTLFAISLLLFQNLLRKVPGQQKRVIGRLLKQR